MSRLKSDLSSYPRRRSNSQYYFPEPTEYFPPVFEESKGISDAELSQVIVKIEAGKQKKVVLKSCNLLDHQFVKVFIASSSAHSETTEIDCSDNKISDKAILNLVNISFENINMKQLNLGHNYITNVSASCFAKSLSGNFILIQIDLTGNPIDQNVLTEMQHLLARNKEIQHELEKISGYSNVFDILMDLATPFNNSLIKLILDYFNDALIPQAREIISKILFLYHETKENTQSMRIVSPDILKERMLQVAAEYNKCLPEPIRPLSDDNQELRFSRIAEPLDTLIAIQPENTSKNSCKSWCSNCILL